MTSLTRKGMTLNFSSPGDDTPPLLGTPGSKKWRWFCEHFSCFFVGDFRVPYFLGWHVLMSLFPTFYLIDPSSCLNCPLPNALMHGQEDIEAKVDIPNIYNYWQKNNLIFRLASTTPSLSHREFHHHGSNVSWNFHSCKFVLKLSIPAEFTIQTISPLTIVRRH